MSTKVKRSEVAKELRDIKRQAQKLVEFVDGFLSTTPFLREDSLREPIARDEADTVSSGLEDTFDAIGDLRADLGAGGRQTSFSGFLRSVGDSLVRAQESLDEQSRQYSVHRATDPLVPPTQFRIPKLKAEMKFALGKVKEEEFDILIYESKRSAETLHQQSIQFEVVSAPVPADALQALRDAIPAASLEISPSAVNSVRQALTALQERHPDASRLLSVLDRDVLLIPLDDRLGRGLSGYGLVVCTEFREGYGGLWLLRFRDEGPREELELVLKREAPLAGAGAGAGLGPHPVLRALYPTVRRLIDRQTAVINVISRLGG